MQLLPRYIACMGIVVALFCGCAAGATTNAGATPTVEDGIQALESSDFRAAYDILSMHAQNGAPQAQLNLGMMYLHGVGVDANPESAVGWFRKAADQDNAEAQFILGMMYMEGLGVSQDHGEAASWIRKAAEPGMPEAQFQLAAQYYRGMGLEQDPGEAASWYRKAAEQGHADAQSNLGVLHLWGHGVPQDYSKAANWYRKAAEQDHTLALFNLAHLYQRGLGVPQDYKAALELHTKAAGQSIAETMTATARDLAMSYQSVNMMVQILPIVVTRDAAQTPAVMAGPDNTDNRRSEQEFYLSLYESVIHARGYESIAGSYQAESTPSCEKTHGSWAIGIHGGALAELKITQDGPKVLMMHRYTSEDSEFDIEVPGSVVENALVFTDPMNSDYDYIGDIAGGRITVRPYVDRILAAWPDGVWKKPTSDDLSNCIVTLTRTKNPQ